MPRLGLVLVIAVGLAWGINWPVLKVGLAEMPPWTFRALMVTPSGLLLLALARASGQSRALPHGQWRPFLLLSFVNITVWYALSAMALRYLASTDGVLIAFTMPLWAAVFARLLVGERLTTRRLAALALGMAGMAAFLGGNLGALGVAPVGAVLMAVGALSWGLGTVLFKRTQWTVPTATLTGWQLTLGGLPLIVGAVVFEGLPLGGYSAAAWGAVTYNLLVSMSFGTYAWCQMVSILPAGAAALCSLLIPVVGVATGHLWLGEPLGLREGLALGFVVAALALTLIPARHPPAT